MNEIIRFKKVSYNKNLVYRINKRVSNKEENVIWFGGDISRYYLN